MTKPKTCQKCDSLYKPRGPAQKYCSTCGPQVKRQVRNLWFNFRRREQGIKIGSGSVKGEEASGYRHGKSVFDRFAKERKEALQHCEECNKDLSVVSRWGWVGHHIDHNQLNNIYSNLKILCKRCHQIEHECWKNFLKV